MKNFIEIFFIVFGEGLFYSIAGQYVGGPKVRQLEIRENL